MATTIPQLGRLKARFASMNLGRPRGAFVRPGGVTRAAIAVGLSYVALAVVFSALTPAWENNDEVAHVQYVEHIVQHGTPPRIAVSNGIESHQPPLYYYLAAVWQRVLGIGPFKPDPQPPTGPALPPTQRVYEVSHDYTPSQHHAAIAVHELRLISIACGVATVLAAFAVGWLLTRRVMIAAALGATVAFWPKFLVVTTAVTNSALVIALCACAVASFLAWRRSESFIWATTTGILLGAAGLTDETALPVAGLMLALLTIYAFRKRDWRGPLAAATGFAVVCGWWYVHDWIAYGDPLANSASRNYLAAAIPGLVRNPPSLSWSAIWDSLKIVGHSTWYDGGWNQLHLPRAIDLIVFVIAAVTFAAALRSKLRERVLFATVALGSVITWLIIVRSTTQAEGRYFLVGIVAFAAFLVAGSEHIGRNRPISLLLWPVIMLGMNVYVVATWLLPYGRL